jgi:hypothetical protein
VTVQIAAAMAFRDERKKVRRFEPVGAGDSRLLAGRARAGCFIRRGSSIGWSLLIHGMPISLCV